MGLFKKKSKKKIELPENGHYVLVCKDCGERLPIPAHTEMPGLTFDFIPDSAVIKTIYDLPGHSRQTLQVDGLRNFFEVDAEEAGNVVLAASFRDNVRMIHNHIATHYETFHAMYLQSANFFCLTYSKKPVPGGLTYENNRLLQLDKLNELAANPKPGKLDIKRAEIPGYSWPLSDEDPDIFNLVKSLDEEDMRLLRTALNSYLKKAPDDQPIIDEIFNRIESGQDISGEELDYCIDAVRYMNSSTRRILNTNMTGHEALFKKLSDMKG